MYFERKTKAKIISTYFIAQINDVIRIVIIVIEIVITEIIIMYTVHTILYFLSNKSLIHILWM